MHVCVCDVEMEMLSSDRLGDGLRLGFVTSLQRDATFLA